MITPSYDRVEQIKKLFEQGRWGQLALLLAQLEANAHQQGVLDPSMTVVPRRQAVTESPLNSIRGVIDEKYCGRIEKESQINPLAGLDFSEPIPDGPGKPERHLAAGRHKRHPISNALLTRKVC